MFSNSKLTPLIILASILLGIGAVKLLPREEEPQIVVPMIDIMVQMPGCSAKEVEERVTKPMEKLLWEIPGVEYIYSTSKPGQALAIVRFVVGENEEAAIVRLNQKMFANFDLIPPGCSQPLIKPRSIDDVPILALTLSSDAVRSLPASPPRRATDRPDQTGRRTSQRSSSSAASAGRCASSSTRASWPPTTSAPPRWCPFSSRPTGSFRPAATPPGTRSSSSRPAVPPERR